LYYIIFGNFKFIKESDTNKLSYLYYTLKTKRFTKEDSKRIGESLGIDWTRFDIEQFRMGLDVELEHGSYDSLTNVSNDHEIISGKIALTYLNEFPDYYTRLQEMEIKAKQEKRQ
jgi:hypothetical protein